MSNSTQGKLKNLMSFMDEMKEARNSPKQGMLFNQLPESIVNHKSNKVQTGPFKRKGDGETFKSAASSHQRGSKQNSLQVGNQRSNQGKSSHENSRAHDAKPYASPNHAKGVQFDSVTFEEKEKEHKRDDSASTEPLVTDSNSEEFSGDEAQEKSEGGSPIAAHQRLIDKSGITEQYGYNPRKLNRIKFRTEKELEEFNFGINFSKLNTSKEQQARLRLFLRKHHVELNRYVELGSAPIFGYPPICYSPPNELKKDKNGNREYISVLMRHVFQKPEHLATLKELITAKKREDVLLENLTKKWMTGEKSSQFGIKASHQNNASLDRSDTKNASFTTSLFARNAQSNASRGEAYGANDTGSKLLKGKRSRKGGNSKEREHSIQTNIRISKGFHEKRQQSNERARSGSKLNDSQAIQESSFAKNASKAKVIGSEKVSLRNSTTIYDTRKMRPATSSMDTNQMIRVRRVKIQKNSASSKISITRNRSPQMIINQKRAAAASAQSGHDNWVAQANYSREYACNLERAGHGNDSLISSSNQWVAPINQQRTSLPMNKKSSVNSINSQSTKPASVVLRNYHGSSELNHSVKESFSSNNNIFASMQNNGGQQRILDQVILKSNLMNHQQRAGSIGVSSTSFKEEHPTYSQHENQQNPLQYTAKPHKQLNKSVSHAGQIIDSQSQFKFGMPPELIYTQEDRNSKLQIQNFKVYRELRQKMASSIQRQRKALKHSIQQYVAADEQTSMMRTAAKRINLARNLTERKNRLRKIAKRNAAEQARHIHETDQMSYQAAENPPLAEEYSMKNFSERPQWAEQRHNSGHINESDGSIENSIIPIQLE